MTETPLKVLVVIDPQKDFIDGSLANEDAQKTIPNLVKKIKEFDGDAIFVTLDTHTNDYLNTNEGKMLPIVHCVQGTDGWLPNDEVDAALREKKEVYFILKPTFGSVEGMYGDMSLPEAIIRKVKGGTPYRHMDIEMCGFVTDICVVSNALILKAFCHDFADITVDASCCAGLTPDKHEAALSVMDSNQIHIINKQQ